MMRIALLPEGLRGKLGEEAAKELVDLINSSAQGAKDAAAESLAERIERRLAETKAEIIKWMFLFWIGQVAVVGALLVAFR